MLLYQILALIYIEKHKKVIQTNEFKISAPTWNQKSELPDASYSASYIQDCFEYIIKKYQKGTDNLPKRI